MKHPIYLLAAAALFTTPVFAGEDACPAKCSEATAKAECCSAKAQHVMLKVKSSDTAAFGKVLTSIDGVSAAETCPQSKFTTVSFNKEKVCADKLMQTLSKAGYKVEAQRITYAVNGLSCGACSDKVTKALSKVKGVADAKVCHESKKAVVEFDPNKVTADKILAAIDETGFKATEAVN